MLHWNIKTDSSHLETVLFVIQTKHMKPQNQDQHFRGTFYSKFKSSNWDTEDSMLYFHKIVDEKNPAKLPQILVGALRLHSRNKCELERQHPS